MGSDYDNQTLATLGFGPSIKLILKTGKCNCKTFMPNCLHVPLAQSQLQKPPLTLPEILIPSHQDSSQYDTQRAKGCEESVTVFPVGQNKNVSTS